MEPWKLVFLVCRAPCAPSSTILRPTPRASFWPPLLPPAILSSLLCRFLVHPSAFLIHRAHRPTVAKNLVITAKKHAKKAKAQSDLQGHAAKKTSQHLKEAAVAAEAVKGSSVAAAANGIVVSSDAQQESARRAEWAWEVAAEQRATVVAAGKAGAHAAAVAAAVDQLLFEDEEDEEEDGEEVEEAEAAEGGDGSSGGGRRQLLLVGRALSEGDGAGAARAPPPSEHGAGTPGGAQGVGVTSTYAYTQMLGEQVRRRMAEGTYEPRGDRALRECLQKLSWWQ